MLKCDFGTENGIVTKRKIICSRSIAYWTQKKDQIKLNLAQLEGGLDQSPTVMVGETNKKQIAESNR
jgi:hypothetical protein